MSATCAGPSMSTLSSAACQRAATRACSRPTSNPRGQRRGRGRQRDVDACVARPAAASCRSAARRSRSRRGRRRWSPLAPAAGRCRRRASRPTGPGRSGLEPDAARRAATGARAARRRPTGRGRPTPGSTRPGSRRRGWARNCVGGLTWNGRHASASATLSRAPARGCARCSAPWPARVGRAGAEGGDVERQIADAPARGRHRQVAVAQRVADARRRPSRDAAVDDQERLEGADPGHRLDRAVLAHQRGDARAVDAEDGPVGLLADIGARVAAARRPARRCG